MPSNGSTHFETDETTDSCFISDCWTLPLFLPSLKTEDNGWFLVSGFRFVVRWQINVLCLTE